MRMGEPESLLLIQLKRAGDVLVTTPVIAALKKRFPLTRIDFLTEKPFAPLLEHHPDLNHLLVYNKTRKSETFRKVRAAHYDWILDFQSSPRSALVCLLSGAALTAGYRVPFWGRVYKTTVKGPGSPLSVVDGKYTLIEHVAGPVAREYERRLHLMVTENDWARVILPTDKPPVGLIPTHRHPVRRWSGESFVEVARRLREQGHPVWWFWGPGEETEVRALAEQVPGSAMIPPASLRLMAALLARCRVVITNDNGPMHLATAVGVPTLTIYGPTEPSSWNPGGPRHRAVTADSLPCLGCNMNRCPFDHECMTHVTPERVLWVLDDLERSLRREG